MIHHKIESRSVDFDNLARFFGIIPPDSKALAGYTVDDKWTYVFIQADKEVRQNIRKLVKVAVAHPTDETIKSVIDAIQIVFEEKVKNENMCSGSD